MNEFGWSCIQVKITILSDLTFRLEILLYSENLTIFADFGKVYNLYQQKSIECIYRHLPSDKKMQ